MHGSSCRVSFVGPSPLCRGSHLYRAIAVEKRRLITGFCFSFTVQNSYSM
jgi:hypothetical protein